MDIDIYRPFFNEDVDLDKILTVYAIPNINNCSDTMAEVYYYTVTGKEYDAERFKQYLQDRRIKKKLITKKDLKSLESKFDRDVLKHFITDPIWNTEEVDPLIKEIVSNYRKDIQNTYLGDITHFYKVNLSLEDRVPVELIYQWNFESKEYKLFSFFRGEN